MTEITFSVFTKPWKVPLPELGRLVKGMGFDAIELPVRPGYQVEPEAVTRGLPEAARILGDCGVRICSVAGPTDEPTMAACAAVGVPIIRICVGIDPALGYMATEAKLQREYDALLPLLERYGVTLGIQNHCGRDVCNAMGVRHLIEKYPPKQIGAVWDPAHCGLNGEWPELALDILWSHLCMVNLKNAFWQRVNGPEAEVAWWRVFWTSGRHGLASWPDVAKELRKREWRGVVCLCAEYSDEASVERLAAEDLAFAKSLFA
ncbi:MAG: sugar phosphate isomerase/epimerase [Armatimonadetes bacterium]|nr:sugar phosphate isomerase/epimerase [Armatimonadota bacterium]